MLLVKSFVYFKGLFLDRKPGYKRDYILMKVFRKQK